MFSRVTEDEALAEVSKHDDEYLQRTFDDSAFDSSTLPHRSTRKNDNFNGISSLNESRDYSFTLPRNTTTRLKKSLILSDTSSDQQRPSKSKSKSFMSSLKHLALPKRKKDRHPSTSSPNSSVNNLPLSSEPVSPYTLSEVLPGPRPRNTMPSEKGQMKSPSSSMKLSKKLSFLKRRSKQKQSSSSTNSLSNYDISKSESVQNTPIRTNA
ncbi:unnamed protein product, partial [Didymodactylos carnosus]